MSLFSGWLSSSWGFYLTQLERRPLVTKCVSGGTLMAIADFLSQNLEKKEQYDWARVARMACVATFITTPPLHFYFKFLDRKLPGTTMPITLKKLAIDQMVVAPLNLAVFMGIGNILEHGGSTAHVKEKFECDYQRTLMANYAVWPAANFVNFRFVPPQQRILFVSFIGLFWNCYLSYQVNRVDDVPSTNIIQSDSDRSPVKKEKSF
eukprot:TRINITY_DN22019_c0_g1_i1.p1 TRINITY_DN22019_c0_g1~~TRINITY_DN22019_c0_g1_i1.p1  ORF type:complete len:207 (+),score=22.14 TRINITY_DN22019_c0_g1_i1:97-717(+)